jgi:hypothetical protein
MHHKGLKVHQGHEASSGYEAAEAIFHQNGIEIQ